MNAPLNPTRARTREAANQLHADGLEPHQITVDRIYALIGQGSRTTINDELKRWRSEHKNGLRPAVEGAPDPVVQAFGAVWQTALEHAQAQFDTWKNAQEAQLAQALEKLDAHTHALAKAEAQTHALGLQLQNTQAEAAHWRHAFEQQTAQTQEARHALEAAVQESALREAAARTREAAHEAKFESARLGWEEEIRTQATTHRLALEKATERLEGVQKHMLEQISLAREQTRQTQAELTRQKALTVAAQHEKQALEKALASLSDVREVEKQQWENQLERLERQLAARGTHALVHRSRPTTRVGKKRLRKPLGQTTSPP